MNGFLLLIPFLIIRFVLLHVLNKESVQRAAHFTPMQGNEKIAYYIYQISNITLFIYLFFLTVEFDFSWLFFLGVVFYSIGLCLCTITIVNFSTPDASGMNTNGIYRFSRNPMYIAYFICYIGMALLTQSSILFAVILIFQFSAHWIILAEERECKEEFGDAYIQYMKKVRRYI